MRKDTERGERLMSERAGLGSWCNADGIAMETKGGKAQTRRRGLNRKEEITASHHRWWWWWWWGVKLVLMRGEVRTDK